MSTHLFERETASDNSTVPRCVRLSTLVGNVGRVEAGTTVSPPPPVRPRPRGRHRRGKRRSWQNVTFLLATVIALVAPGTAASLGSTAGAEAAAADTALIASRPGKNFNAYVKRVESLTYIRGGDALWSTNDSRRRRNMAGMDPENQRITQEIDRGEVFFGPAVGASSTNHRELETIANDGNKTLYVVNTVNDKRLCGDDILDLATVFRLTRPRRSADFAIADWQLLPSANECGGNEVVSGYDALVVIEGDLYFGSGNEIRRYDYESNEFVTDDRGRRVALDVSSTIGRQIRDLAYDGEHLWVLGYNRHGQWLAKYLWATRELVGWQDLDDLGLTNPRGLAVKGNTLFIGENTQHTEHNVHVFSIVRPPGGATHLSPAARGA